MATDSNEDLERLLCNLESDLVERRVAGSRPFDMRPVIEAGLDELDHDYAANQFVPRAVAPDVLEQNNRPLEQQLRSLRLIIDQHPTWGAILGLGRDPQGWLPGAYVQFLRLDGREVTDQIREAPHRQTGGRVAAPR